MRRERLEDALRARGRRDLPAALDGAGDHDHREHGLGAARARAEQPAEQAPAAPRRTAYVDSRGAISCASLATLGTRDVLLMLAAGFLMGTLWVYFVPHSCAAAVVGADGTSADRSANDLAQTTDNHDDKSAQAELDTSKGSGSVEKRRCYDATIVVIIQDVRSNHT